MKKRLLSLVMAAAMAMSLVACSSSASTGADGKAAEEASGGQEFVIGGSGPLTGGAAIYGEAVKNGGQIAVDEINAAGGINGYPVKWVFEDDENDTEKAVNAYNTLKDQGLQMMVGTVTSNPCLGITPLTESDNMFEITPSGTTKDITIPKNVFRMCFSDPAQGTKSAEYIGEHKIATKVGIIYDSSDSYSSGIYETFTAAAKENGFEIVGAEAFTADSKTDFTTQLTKIKNAGAELVFLPFYYTEASLVLKQANDMGYAPIFFGCDGMDGILDLEGFDKSLAEGLMLLTPFAADATDDLTVNFVKTYKEKYGSVPIQFAADAYDCLYAIKAAAEKAGITPDMSISDISDKMQTAMTEIKINGLTGSDITFTADGEPNKAPKAVVIENGAYKAAD